MKNKQLSRVNVKTELFADIPKIYLCVESCSLLNLAFVESFAKRVTNEACILVNYLSWFLKDSIIIFNTYFRKWRKKLYF